jgi:hypothetical protein
MWTGLLAPMERLLGSLALALCASITRRARRCRRQRIDRERHKGYADDPAAFALAHDTYLLHHVSDHIYLMGYNYSTMPRPSCVRSGARASPSFAIVVYGAVLASRVLSFHSPPPKPLSAVDDGPECRRSARGDRARGCHLGAWSVCADRPTAKGSRVSMAGKANQTPERETHLKQPPALFVLFCQVFQTVHQLQPRLRRLDFRIDLAVRL